MSTVKKNENRKWLGRVHAPVQKVFQMQPERVKAVEIKPRDSRWSEPVPN
jgi:hypothetical protein